MNKRRRFSMALLALGLGVVVGIWIHHRAVPAGAVVAGGLRREALENGPRSPSETPGTGVEVSPIADTLNSPSTTVQRDVAIVVEVLEAWRSNFPGVGNPVGDNREICLALKGNNALHFAFLSPTHRALNASGELCDRWGTPFRFHAWSGTRMAVTSAGPDKRFGTADDVSSEPEAATSVTQP